MNRKEEKQETFEEFVASIFDEFNQLTSKYGKLSNTPLSSSCEKKNYILKKKEGNEELLLVLSAFYAYESKTVSYPKPEKQNQKQKNNTQSALIATVAYLASGIKDWKNLDLRINGNIRTALSQWATPLNIDFLDELDLSDENNCFAALSYILNIPNLDRRCQTDIDPITAINRIKTVFSIKNACLCINDATSNIPISILTGLVPMRRTLMTRMFKYQLTKETAKETLQFFIFMSEANEKDIYEKGKTYGNWRPIPIENILMNYIPQEEAAAVNTIFCANGLTKTEIEERVIPLIRSFESTNPRNMEILSSAIRTRVFDNPEFPLEKLMENTLEISNALKQNIHDQNANATQNYWNIMRVIGNYANDITTQQNPEATKSTTIGIIATCYKIKLVTEYLKNNSKFANKIAAFLLAMTPKNEQNLNEDTRTLSTTAIYLQEATRTETFERKTPLFETTLDMLLKTACIAKTRTDEETAKTLMTIAEYPDRKSLKNMTLEQWSKMNDILACSENVPIAWAAAAALEKDTQ